ncbi:MAG: Fic family protein [Truepera sp.]|nr:Fic family protein [Truepera sp.]
MSETLSGRYVTDTTSGEEVRAFVPDPLPPNPPIWLSGELQDLLGRANQALGRLDAIGSLLPDTSLFLYMYVRKEAVLSSQIEGTQSSLSDLLLYEVDGTPGAPIDDVVQVSNYVRAVTYGLRRIREDNFPISSRLLCEVHGELLRGSRGGLSAGELRRSQNWIGGSRPGNAIFVPPPHTEVPRLIADLERFIHDQPERTPTLIKAALAHVQFETIHPFLDGNGRLGRLLITLLLCSEKVLKEPTLYLSLYFKTHRDSYYNLLQRVRLEGAWGEWLEFFLQGVIETAEQAFGTALRLLDLFDRDRKRIEGLGRRAGSSLQVHQYLQRRPFIRVSESRKELPLSVPTILNAIRSLEELGIVREVTGRARNRLWVYGGYLEILSEGADPLS